MPLALVFFGRILLTMPRSANVVTSSSPADGQVSQFANGPVTLENTSKARNKYMFFV